MDRPVQAYQGDEPFVFVCYSHDDTDVVHPEIGWLQVQGINVWYDEGISAGRVWRAEIAQAIDACSSVLYYVSESSLDSAHCNREINLALDQEKTILPVYLDDVELTDDLRVGLSRIHALHRDQDTSYREHLRQALGQPAEPVLRSSHRKPKGRVAWAWTFGILMALGLTLVVYWRTTRESLDSVPLNRSVAVFPFTVVGDSSSLEALALGLTQDVTASLGAYQDLKTVAPGSTTASDSSTGYVLNGSVQGNGGSVLVRVRLIRSAGRQPVWSDNFERPIETSAVPLTRLAETISRFVRWQLVRDHQCESVKRRSNSLEAAESACVAMAESYRSNQGAGTDPEIIMAHSERAFALDPSLPEAWILAITGHYLRVAWWGRSSYPASADRVRELLDELPEAFLSNAWVQYTLAVTLHAMFLDHEAAKLHSRQALALDPLNPLVHWFHAMIGTGYWHEGNLAEAIRHYRRALRVYDSDARILSEYTTIMNMAGLHQEALDGADLGLALTDGGWVHATLLANRYEAQRSLGDTDGARETLRLGLRELTAPWQGFLLPALVDSGRMAEAQLLLKELEADANVPPNVLIRGFIALGMFDRAFASLHRAIDEHSILVVTWLRLNPAYDEMRNDPRWDEIMRHLNDEETRARAENPFLTGT